MNKSTIMVEIWETDSQKVKKKPNNILTLTYSPSVYIYYKSFLVFHSKLTPGINCSLWGFFILFSPSKVSIVSTRRFCVARLSCDFFPPPKTKFVGFFGRKCEDNFLSDLIWISSVKNAIKWCINACVPRLKIKFGLSRNPIIYNKFFKHRHTTWWKGSKWRYLTNTWLFQGESTIHQIMVFVVSDDQLIYVTCFPVQH